MIDLNLLIFAGIFICVYKLLSKGTIINIGGTVNYYNNEDEQDQEKASQTLSKLVKKLPR